ncbi:Tryptophan--tRNA ligase, mitochondrial [Toxocara canis]|uniref:tryptophan--tRNA ligase n=1 Tax=Toxocara canis TaxID=6265 RepID=A0A0B2URN4_TOXCA|nr:Tryptophan--tRNA ligase, mitochondrial [Toxocara canis]
MQTYVAEISEILRAQRRDEEHLEQLEAEFSAILKDLAGVSFWIRNYKYIPIWIKTAYYALTTLSGAQTLGEEYLSLVQVSDAEGRLIPSIWRRLIFVFLHVFVPLLADASLLRLQRLINHADTRTFLGVELSNNRKARQTFAQIVEWTRTKGLPSLNRLHLAIFYLSGAYYNISKRVAGIEYISFRPQTNIRMFALRLLAKCGRSACLLTESGECVLHRVRCSARTYSTADVTSHPTVYFSGIQPTGVPHLGNYFGFIQPWLNIQNTEPSTSALYLSIADYHAISTGFVPPEQMRSNIVLMAAGLLACGVNPERTVLFQQSEVHEHTNLMFILGALQTVTKLQRMPQYKDKAKKYKAGEVPVNLLIYPVLQAADVLLYKGTHVPVGDDQAQHMNLLTDLAVHFNSVTGVNYFPIPVKVSGSYARIRSLRDAAKKMSKSDANSRSRIEINDSREKIFEKCAKALSDFESNITYEPKRRPAISNLVTLLSAVNGKTTEDIVKECASLDTRQFKEVLATAIDTHFAPIRERFETLLNDKNTIKDILEDGARKARKTAVSNLEHIKQIIALKL